MLSALKLIRLVVCHIEDVIFYETIFISCLVFVHLAPILTDKELFFIDFVCKIIFHSFTVEILDF